MKAILFGLLMLPVILSTSEAEITGNAGVGVIFGDPTGVSWTLRTGDQNALSGAVGFGPGERFRVHADYVWYAWPFRSQDFALYYGIGGALGVWNSPPPPSDGDPAFGARVPLGIAYFMPGGPLEVFLEVAPLFVLVPSTGVDVDGGIAARFRF
jgi:hypothetical protein